jgi:hypothetical protein
VQYAGEDDEKKEVFVEQQHKIIKRYGMNGHFTYIEISSFHELINQQNHLLISVFEVFALNRNVPDFIENLKMIAEIERRSKSYYLC